MRDQSSGTEPNGLRSYALTGYRWLLLAFLMAGCATTRHGTGLQGMADRLAALGGALRVRSRPGEGTTLSGELPVSAPGQVRLPQPCA